jgi:hypothetical protein
MIGYWVIHRSRIFGAADPAVSEIVLFKNMYGIRAVGITYAAIVVPSHRKFSTSWNAAVIDDRVFCARLTLYDAH